MRLKTKLFGSVYQFASIKEVLAKANEEKSGCGPKKGEKSEE